MADTLHTPPATRRRVGALAALAVVAAVVATAGFALSRGDDKPAYPVVRMTPTDHEVLYEVSGSGASPAVTFITGADNREQTLLDVPLPWRQTVTIPVGPAGGHANVEVRSPGTGAGSVACTMFLDGVQVAQNVSTDGFAGVACSALIPPTYVK